MLSLAQPVENVTYVSGSAENLPVADRSCDLITVGSALHWFDQSGFLAEADRVAKPDAWLVVHDHWFAGQMQGNAAFTQWMREVYLATHPSPPRDRSWRPPDDLGAWQHKGWERYDQLVTFTPARLASYLLTQSNLQRALEPGSQSEEGLRSWLVTETTPFFRNDSSAVFLFGGFVACHRRPR
jgi:SAM-dependent methyltransferase